MSIEVGDTTGQLPGTEVDDEIEIEVEVGEGEGSEQPAPAPKEEARGADAHREEGEEETPAERRERLKRTSRERRQHRRQVATQDQELIASLTETVKQLADQVKEVKGTVTRMSVQEAVNARGHWIRQARAAQAKEAKAIENGDGEEAIKAREAYRRAYDNAVYYDSMLPDENEQPPREQPQREPVQPQQKPQASDQDALREAVMRNRSVFERKHSWYDPNGTDPDSVRVREIDARLSASRPDLKPWLAGYWQALEAEMEKHGMLIGDDDDAGAEPARDEPPRDERGRFVPQQAPAKPPGGPPVAGRTEGSGTKVKIPKALHDAMVESGVINDPKAKKRVVDAYFARLNGKK